MYSLLDADRHTLRTAWPVTLSTAIQRSADRLHERLKAMVAAYHLRPGERINEVELARRFGVSRTPLREALNRLASEGFLLATANRGYHVRPLDAAQVLRLYEYRAVLEAGALRLSAERATPEALGALRDFARRSRDEPEDDAADQPVPEQRRGGLSNLLRRDRDAHGGVGTSSLSRDGVDRLNGVILELLELKRLLDQVR